MFDELGPLIIFILYIVYQAYKAQRKRAELRKKQPSQPSSQPSGTGMQKKPRYKATASSPAGQAGNVRAQQQPAEPKPVDDVMRAFYEEFGLMQDKNAPEQEVVKPVKQVYDFTTEGSIPAVEATADEVIPLAMTGREEGEAQITPTGPAVVESDKESGGRFNMEDAIIYEAVLNRPKF